MDDSSLLIWVVCFGFRFLARGALGHVGVLVAALLIAASPILRTTSRYYMQVLFVFFTLVRWSVSGATKLQSKSLGQSGLVFLVD